LDQQGPAGFFALYDRLLIVPLNPESIRGAAASAGLDPNRLEQALADHRHLRRMTADVHLAESTGETGAPNFFINSRHIGGAKPYADFARVVDDELVRARQIAAAGVPREQIFERILEHSHAVQETRLSKPGEPKRVWIRQIIIAYGGYGLSPPDRTREQARAMILAVHKRARAGEDFADLARQHSEGSNAAQGGVHGELARGDLTKDVEDAAFALEVGGVSEVLESEHGFEIVQRYK
jgi:hypothetical protein